MDLVESYRQDLALARTPVTRALLAALLVALAMFPWVAAEHFVFLATLVALYSIGVMGQNILIGYTGQISFGQAGFLAIGAFAFGHLRIWGAPFLVALVAAGGVAALAGVVVGFPSLRLKGPYLAIATLGFGVAVYQIFVNWEVLSGGRSGLAITKLSPMFGLSGRRYEYYLYVLLLVGFTLATYNLISSYVGRAFAAIPSPSRPSTRASTVRSTRRCSATSSPRSSTSRRPSRSSWPSSSAAWPPSRGPFWGPPSSSSSPRSSPTSARWFPSSTG
ncbi:MAG: hypothetical protein AUG00_06510 [Candidatus Rokubacteria bacterium 13_1_20CM_2_70_7]|nr:MAG: hypothetical protein AUG00_06510 [Candidatus Rokubacteria bacterium 13_1_20CM_2_70_7]